MVDRQDRSDTLVNHPPVNAPLVSLGQIAAPPLVSLGQIAAPRRVTARSTVPAISVLMPAYNGERYIRTSVESVLAQTESDFELLVVDDASTDRTPEILAAIPDRRLRVLTNRTNLGIVGSLNRAMAEARGGYIARTDADDLCLPTRFAAQKQYLDQHPETLVLGTGMSVFEQGEIRFSRQIADQDLKVLRWMLHVGNPVGHPSMMFRASLIDTLGDYLRETYKYAEDFDFSHRVMHLGDIAVLPKHLVIYRQHEQNLTRTRRTEMVNRTAAVLADVYASLLGQPSEAEAALVARHMICGFPMLNAGAVERLGAFLNQLIPCFASAYDLTPMQFEAVVTHTSNVWWRALLATSRAGRVSDAFLKHQNFDWSEASRPPVWRIARSCMVGLLPLRPWFARPAVSGRVRSDPVIMNDVAYQPLPVANDDPPRLYIVVDTEAEFDWSKGFDRGQTKVSAMSEQQPAQAIFDGYGARPIYVVDYAVASQPDGYGPLREIFDRRGCAIGAHLHPWVNPPFEEDVSDFHSFGGNLPPGLEERKLTALVETIREGFGVSPLFFKAGRYGIGRNTINILHRLGFAVDFSLLPLADLRARGGPDFRFAEARPYRAGAEGMLSLPMTRGQLGLLAPLPPVLHGALHSKRAAKWHLPGILSGMRLANTVTLTPEGVPAREQIRLIDRLMRRGCRTFVLHYHSPSLAGHTPYVRTPRERKEFLINIEDVCRFFFDTMGGMPGNPADLVPAQMRDKVWKAEDAALASPTLTSALPR